MWAYVSHFSHWVIVASLVEKNKRGDLTYRFWPTVDYFAETPFLPSNPITILHNKQQKMVPYMTGLNKDEGVQLCHDDIMLNIVYEGAMVTASQWKHMKPEDNQLQEHWETVAGRFIFTQEYGNQTYEEKLRTMVFTKFYLGGKEGVSRDNIQAMNDLYTDSYFAAPNTEAVRLHAAAPAPVYNYLLTYRGSSSFSVFFAAGDPEAAKVRPSEYHSQTSEIQQKQTYLDNLIFNI